MNGNTHHSRRSGCPLPDNCLNVLNIGFVFNHLNGIDYEYFCFMHVFVGERHPKGISSLRHSTPRPTKWNMKSMHFYRAKKSCLVYWILRCIGKRNL